MSQEPGSLFPLFDKADVARTASEPIYDGLINRDSKDNSYPEVAWYAPTIENGGAYFAGVSDDRHLVVKYKLRRGIKWSDGVEITTADALYHHKLALDPNSPVPDRTLYEKIYYVDSPDRHTVIFNYMSHVQARDLYNKSKDKERVAFLKQFVDERRPVTDPMYNMVGNILPSHILSKLRPERMLSSEYARNPVGNGPFKVERWDPGSQIVLVQNPNYNLTDKPPLKRIVIRLIADQNQVLAQLRSGALDAATRDVFPNPMAALGNWGADPKVVYAPSYAWERIDFNLDRPIFQDKAVRQAIAHAINRQKIIDEVMLGKSPVQHTFISPASWASMQNPDFARGWESKFPVKKYEHNPDLANQMLDKAGWARGPDGIRTKGDVTLSFVYAAVSGNRASRQIAELVVRDLKAAGVDARIQYVTSCPGYPDCDYLRKRQHDLAAYAAPSSADPSGSNYDSRNIPTPENQYRGTNYSGYRNPRFDELSRAAANELDRTKRAPLFAEMQAIWAEDLPAVPLYPRLNIEVHKLSLVGWETSVGSTPSTYKIAAMYFK
jgi:peptide/nickel transport system substrate-binding protein